MTRTSSKFHIFDVSVLVMRLVIIFSFLFVTSTAFAQSQNAPKNGSQHAQILEASMRRVLPGRPETPIVDEYKFTIAWISFIPPDSFIAYCDGKWRKCGVAMSDRPVFDVQKIRKGDRIEISLQEPATNPFKSKNYKPKNNTIYFKTKNSYWFCITAKTVTRKPDLALP